TPRGFDSATDYTVIRIFSRRWVTQWVTHPVGGLLSKTLLFLIAGAQTQVMDFALSSLLLAPSLAGWHSRIGFSTLVAQLQTNTMYRHIHDEN
ncbi:hypothetical protein PF004_g31096, partial [Phytophthora fragariae]